MSSARTRLDSLTARLMQSMTVISVLLTILIGLGLLIKAWPILSEHSLWKMLTDENWKPFKAEFGFYPFIMGTVWVTVLALIIS